ncbi:hypothetical protein K0M31_013565 [Melipona bicolor]|uniref:Uncharacterized protein n=1 Tax=Melipona bicolor TaxID=60889 RepID=A0AA40KG75_9HYME|nr:hypothetical protein K0M31_013565 [Melipona bicolor]
MGNSRSFCAAINSLLCSLVATSARFRISEFSGHWTSLQTTAYLQSPFESPSSMSLQAEGEEEWEEERASEVHERDGDRFEGALVRWKRRMEAEWGGPSFVRELSSRAEHGEIDGNQAANRSVLHIDVFPWHLTFTRV